MATPRQTLTVQLAHANMRIAELESCQAVDARRITELESDLAAAMRLAAQPRAARPAPRGAWVRPAWMEAARELAMRTGAVVKLGA